MFYNIVYNTLSLIGHILSDATVARELIVMVAAWYLFPRDLVHVLTAVVQFIPTVQLEVMVIRD